MIEIKSITYSGITFINPPISNISLNTSMYLLEKDVLNPLPDWIETSDISENGFLI